MLLNSLSTHLGGCALRSLRCVVTTPSKIISLSTMASPTTAGATPDATPSDSTLSWIFSDMFLVSSLPTQALFSKIMAFISSREMFIPLSAISVLQLHFFNAQVLFR